MYRKHVKTKFNNSNKQIEGQVVTITQEFLPFILKQQCLYILKCLKKKISLDYKVCCLKVTHQNIKPKTAADFML